MEPPLYMPATLSLEVWIFRGKTRTFLPVSLDTLHRDVYDAGVTDVHLDEVAGRDEPEDGGPGFLQEQLHFGKVYQDLARCLNSSHAMAPVLGWRGLAVGL
jgi:hypothetical protein